MRDLLHYTIDTQGRVRISQAPPVGATVIFSENYLLNRCDTEEPGVVTWPSKPALPVIDEIVTVDPTLGPTMTFQLVDISPYQDALGDVPDPSIMVLYFMRVT